MWHHRNSDLLHTESIISILGDIFVYNFLAADFQALEFRPTEFTRVENSYLLSAFRKSKVNFS